MQRYNLNQKKLCQLCNIKESTFSYYLRENDSRMPKGGDMVNLATALHTTVDYLLGAQTRNMDFDELKILLAKSSMDMTKAQITELSSMLMLAYARQQETPKDVTTMELQCN